MLSPYRRRRWINRICLSLSLAAMLFGLFWLAWILWTLLRYGLHGISYQLFTQMTPPPGSNGGLLNAIYGSLVMSVVATAIGTPVG